MARTTPATRTAQTIAQVKSAALSGRMRGQLRWALDELAVTIGRTATVVAQTRSRLAGQMPDSATRLVSLHDPDARPIRKGRIDKPVEFGYKARVTDNDELEHQLTPFQVEVASGRTRNPAERKRRFMAG